MRLRTLTFSSLCAIALAGCATLNGPEAQQNAAANEQSCKVITVSSVSESLRLQNQRNVAGDAIERTEGNLDLGHVRLNEPRQLRSRTVPLEGISNRLQRSC